jgi:tetratricopeptide (TPR) repeat protein
MDNLDYIENYFTNKPGTELTREFEGRINSDPGFAEEVAFYLAAYEVSKESAGNEKKQRFKETYQKNRVARFVPVKKLVYYVATAAVVSGLIFGTYIFFRPVPPQQLAAQYEKENLQTLPVTMSGRSDSLQTGLRLYNEGKYSEALTQFENIIRSDSSHFSAEQYAGISALRLKEYDQALSYFEQMATRQGLYSNPAQILQAITLMERNLPGDVAKAKQLLQEIVSNDFEGKEDAEKLLRKMK